MAKTESLRAETLCSMAGHVCVVTGCGTGIGLTATQALAANGARVYITGPRMEALESAAKTHEPSAGGQIIPIGPCDVTEKEDLENLVAEIEKKEKYINVLVCNTGISGQKAEPKSEKATELKKALFEVESFEESRGTRVFLGVHLTTDAFLPLLQAGRDSHDHLSASVIVISPMSPMMPVMGHVRGHFSYDDVPVHLSWLISDEFKEAGGIRLNSIAPGYFPSEMTTGESDGHQKSGIPDEKMKEKGHIPAERAVAQVILFLAKNKYVDGENIVID